MGRSNLGGGSGVVYGVASGLVEEPRIAEVLGVDGPSITRKRNSIDSRSVSILYTSAWTTSGSPARKQSSRAPKRAWWVLTMKNKISSVVKFIPLNQRRGGKHDSCSS